MTPEFTDLNGVKVALKLAIRFLKQLGKVDAASGVSQAVAAIEAEDQVDRIKKIKEKMTNEM